MAPALKRCAADLDDFVVVVEVCLRQIEDEFCLQRSHKCSAQSKDHVPIQVLMLRLCDTRAFLRAFQTQFALVFAFMQITEVRLLRSALERSPYPVVRRNLRAVSRKVNCGLGRRNAVISSAFISSTLSASALRRRV